MLDITAVKDAYRQDVNLLGAQAVADLAKGYAATWEKLYAGWKSLADRVLQDRAAGRPIRPGDLYRMERFKAMMWGARAAYGDIAAQGRAIAMSTVDAAFGAAVRDHRAIRDDLFDAGIVIPNAGDWHVNVDRDLLMASLGYSAAGGPLHDLFAAVAADGVAATRKALVSGIVAGKGTDVIARNMRKVLALSLYRSQLIARTEAHRAYREVARVTAEQNPGAFDGWMWRAACDARTCPICWAKHGSIHPASEPMRTHPGCRCAAVPNPRSFASIVGEPIPDATAAYRQTGGELFAAKGAGTQLRVLGPGRFARYQQGMHLTQMIEDGPRNRWGRTPRLIPLRRLGGIPPRGRPGQAFTAPAAPPAAVPASRHRPFRTHERLRNERRVAAGEAPLVWGGKGWVIPGRPKQKTHVRRPKVAPAPVGAPQAGAGARGGAQAPPARPPTPVAPLFPARPAAVARVNGRDAMLPPVPAGARPMLLDEMQRHQRRVDRGDPGLIWKPRAGGEPGKGHWGAPPAAPRLTSHGGLAGRPKVGQQANIAGVNVRVTSHGGASIEAGHGQPRQHVPGQGPIPHPAKLPTPPGARAPAPVPSHAVRGGAPPRPAVQRAGGAQLRRWLRWQAENPNAPRWQEPPAAYLAGKMRAARQGTIGPRSGRPGQPLVVRKRAEQTPVFAPGRARTGQNEPVWAGLRRAKAGAYKAARDRSAARAAAQAGLRRAAPPVPPAPKPPSVLAPLPATPIKKTAKADKTGTATGMVPRAKTHPTARAVGANPISVAAGRDRNPALERALRRGRFLRRDPGNSRTSSEGFEAWIEDPITKREIHVYIKPTSGQHHTAAGRQGRDYGIKPYTESEREYGAFRVNQLLGTPLDHQVSAIRDFGLVYDENGRPHRIGRAVINVWTDPPTGHTLVKHPSFTDVPDAERATAAMFDGLIFNVDRHAGNWYGMVDPRGTTHITAIDPSLAFPYVRDGQADYMWKNTNWTDRSYPLAPTDLRRLEGFLLNEAAIRTEFEALIGQNATDGMFKRARWMYQHGRTLSTSDLDAKTWWNS